MGLPFDKFTSTLNVSPAKAVGTKTKDANARENTIID
jgi:hypothetical protein